MSHSIPAIFDSGVFKPLVPVDLAEGTRVEVGLPAPSIRPSGAAHDPARWQQFVRDMEALPENAPHDGFSNRDHDRLIYGE